jgi:hypothetical protein
MTTPAPVLTETPYKFVTNADGTITLHVVAAPPTSGFPATPAGYAVAWQKLFADYASMAAFLADFYPWSANPAASSPWTIWDPAMLSLAILSNGVRGLRCHAQSEAGGMVRTGGFGRKVAFAPPTIVQVHCKRPSLAGLKRNGGIFWATDGKEPQEGEGDSAEDDGTGTSLDINLHIGTSWPAQVGSVHLANINTTVWGWLTMEVTPTGLKTTWQPDAGTAASVSLAHSFPATPHNCDSQVEALHSGVVIPAGGVDFEWDLWQELVAA